MDTYEWQMPHGRPVGSQGQHLDEDKQSYMHTLDKTASQGFIMFIIVIYMLYSDIGTYMYTNDCVLWVAS